MLKEYHVFEVLHIDCCKSLFGKRMQFSLRRIRGESDQLRRHFRDNIGEYFEYFASILARNGNTLTGDITPSYAGLPTAVFREIKTQFNELGIQVKVIFLMRDPVARCISHAQMWMADRPALFADRPFETVLKELCRTDAFEMRTRYDSTIKRLDEVFPHEDVYLAASEKLFSADSTELHRLADFLDLELHEKLRLRKVNETPSGIDVSIPTKRLIAEHYKDVYEYVDANVFSVGDIWENAFFTT